MIKTKESRFPDEAAKAAIVAALAEHNAMLPTAERNAWLRVCSVMVFWVAVLGALASYGFRNFELAFFGMFLWALAGIRLWKFAWQPITELRQTARDIVMPRLFEFIADVRYRNGEKPLFLARIPTAALLVYNNSEVDDSLSGRYEGSAFALAECKLWDQSGDSQRLEFAGIVFNFRLDDAFPGTLVATRQLRLGEKIEHALFGGDGMNEIALGDADLRQRYRVRTDAPDAAAKLLAAGLENVLAYLAEAWPEGLPRVALAGSECYLLLSTERNFFEVPFGTPIDYDMHVAPMLHELEMLLATAKLVRQAAIATAPRTKRARRGN